MPKKRILFFHPHTGKGGTEHNILRISKGLYDKEYEVHFCCFEDDDIMYETAERYAASCTVLGNLQKSPRNVISAYRKLIVDIQPDVVLNFGLRVELFSRVFSKRFGVKKIISNIRSTDDWRKKSHTWLDRLTKHRSDAWVSNSKAGKAIFCKREKLDKDKVHVIYNFIDPLPARKKTHTIDNIFHIGVLAHLREVKGHKDLLDICRRLHSLNVLHQFHLAGKDLMDGNLFKMISEQGLTDNFVYHGYISDLSAFLPNMHCTLLPSYWEGLPTSVLESMSYGIPSVATAVGGVPEIITQDYNGCIVQPGDTEGIADTLYNLYSNLPLRESLSKNGHASIKDRFAKESIMNQWIEVVEVV